MYYFHFSFMPHWGLMLNEYGFNKSRPALSFIPPTTIIGALGYCLNRLLGRPETYGEDSGAERYREIFHSVNIAMPSLTLHYDLSRVLFMHRGEAKSDAVAVGKLYSISKDPGSVVEVIIIVNEEEAEKNLGNAWRDLMRASCISITRVGARESIVTPLDIKEGKPRPISDKVIETKFSLPSFSLKRILEGTYVASEAIDWRKTKIGRYVGATTTGYIVPTSPQGLKVELKESYQAYKCGDEVIISWR